MHIPDGFIDGKTAPTTLALSAVGVGLALLLARSLVPGGAGEGQPGEP